MPRLSGGGGPSWLHLLIMPEHAGVLEPCGPSEVGPLKTSGRAVDVTTVTESRPTPDRGAPPQPRSPSPAEPDVATSPPSSDAVSPVLRRFRDQAAVRSPDPAVVGPRSIGQSGPLVSAPGAALPADDAEWTFHPDGAVERRVLADDDPGDFPDDATESGRRRRVAPRVGVLVIVLALITGALAVTHIGPFGSPSGAASPSSSVSSAPPDVRGSWSAIIGFAESLYTETLQITNENLSSGRFSGTITSPVGVEKMKGTLVGATMSFEISFGTATDRGVATVSAYAGTLRLKGDFSSPVGGQGTIVATRGT
jgi:hypothetical protein